jgi:hypothetical protein
VTRFLTLEEAAVRVDRGESTIRRWIDKGLMSVAGRIPEQSLLEFEKKMRDRRGRPRKASGGGKVIVLASSVSDVVVVTPTSIDRARGVLGRELLVSDSLDSVERVQLLEAVVPCFATVPSSLDSGVTP